MPTVGNILSYDELKRARNKAKASRSFSRMYEDAPSSATQGSRPALYRAEMGHCQRRATRMQRSGAGRTCNNLYSGSRRTTGFAQEAGTFVSQASGKLSRRFVIVMGAIVILCIFAFCVFPAAQQYYVSMRQNAQLQAEAQAVADRTEALATEVEYLKTDSGVEAQAREQLGWIKEGENAVEVYGLPASATKKSTSAETVVASGSVPAPETWYSPILDPLFGYET